MSGETHFEFTVKSDGHPMAVPGNPAFNQVELRKIDKSQAEIRENKGWSSRGDGSAKALRWTGTS